MAVHEDGMEQFCLDFQPTLPTRAQNRQLQTFWAFTSTWIQIIDLS